MIGIVYATLREAEPLLNEVSWVASENSDFATYLFSSGSSRNYDGVIVLSGMGFLLAKRATRFLIDEYNVDTVINAGICGTVVDSFPLGSVFRVVETFRYFPDLQQVVAVQVMDPQLIGFAELEQARLITCAAPMYDIEQRQRIARYGELVDMEGAAVADECADREVSCYLVKGVSDYANELGKQSLSCNIDWVSGKIAAKVLAEISKL